MRGRLAPAIVAGIACVALATPAPPPVAPATPAISVEPLEQPSPPSDDRAQHATVPVDGTWRRLTPAERARAGLDDTVATYRQEITIPAGLVGGTRRLRLRFEPASDVVDVQWDGRPLAGHGAFALPVETTAGRHDLVVRVRTRPPSLSLLASGPVTVDDVSVAARPSGHGSADVVLAYTLTNRSSVDLVVELTTTFAGPGLDPARPPAVGATIALHPGANRAELRTHLRGVEPAASYAADSRLVFDVTSDRRLDRFALRRRHDAAPLR